VRAKAVIRDKAIPYQVPVSQELPARLGAVLQVMYPVFNEGYSAGTAGAELSCEAIRVGRLLVDLPVLDECFEHNDYLRATGHLVAEAALQPPETAVTLYWKNGKVATTDGPYAETKEQLGGLQILEARDLNHAIQLVSQLPGFKYGLGPIEIRPLADLSEMIKESERRRKDTPR
jgi:hypothetical protein